MDSPVDIVDIEGFNGFGIGFAWFLSDEKFGGNHEKQNFID